MMKKKAIPHHALLLLALTASIHVSGITPVTRILRKSPSLVALDRQLRNEYRKTLEKAEEPMALILSERVWLKQIRDACTDEPCLQSVYEERLAWLRQVKRFSLITYTNPRLGISFEYQSNRRVEVDDQNDIQVVDKLNRSAYSQVLFIEMSKGNLVRVASRNGYFFRDEEDGNVWKASSRGIPPKTRFIRGNGWKGMLATVSGGINNPNGGESLGDYYAAAISNGRRGLTISGEPTTEFLHCLQSIQLLEPAKP
jgi:uncharacterized protein